MLLSDLASSLRESGVDVVSLAAGEPDFDTPQEIIDAGIEALRRALVGICIRSEAVLLTV